MDLRDATLVILTESFLHQELAGLAQSVYQDMAAGREVPYQRLSEIIGKVSDKGVLRAMHRKYSATAYDAILMPILTEIGQRAPVPPRRQPATEPDWLTAPYPFGS